MGTQEFAGGPIILLVLFVLFSMMNEDGLVATLGVVGKLLWILIRGYLVIAPVFIIMWLLSLIGFTYEYPVLSYLISFFGWYVVLVWFMGRKEKKERESDKS